MNNELQNRFVRTFEAAEFLGVSPKTLEKWRWTGDGPEFRRHGGVVVYWLPELRAWSDSRACQSTTKAGEARART